jgi:hypothetical protein
VFNKMPRYRRRGGANETIKETDVGMTCTGDIVPSQAFAAVGAPGVVNVDEEEKERDLKKAKVDGDVPAGDEDMDGGRRRRHSRRHHRHRRTLRAVPKGVHVKAKTLKKLLKSRGLKVSGKKATLRARARKAHLIRGGAVVGVLSSSPAAV